MNFGKIVDGQLLRLGAKVMVEGVMVDADSAEAEAFRAEYGWKPLNETAPEVPRGFVACVSSYSEGDDEIVVSYTTKPLAEASPLDIARSLNWQTISAMTDREKTAVMQKMAKYINERAY